MKLPAGCVLRSIVFQHHHHAAAAVGLVRLPSDLWTFIGALTVSIAMTLATQSYIQGRSSINVAKLQSDVLTIQRQMANKDDMLEIRRSIGRLEVDITKMSSHLPSGR